MTIPKRNKNKKVERDKVAPPSKKNKGEPRLKPKGMDRR
jgi:hypothetical protein